MKKTNTIVKLLMAAFAATAMTLTSLAEVDMEMVNTDHGAAAAMLITKNEVVTAIDYETRAVTLVDELGKEVTVKAAPEVERFDEVEVGDLVEIDYYLSVAAELRAPTEEELENPIEVVEEDVRAAPESAPAGADITMIKAVCVVEGLDRPTETVTLMGPLGGLNIVRVADVDNLSKMRIGDTVVVTFTEAMAIRLEKVEAAETEAPAESE
jgi:Cu/Ag efflux protein CusF